VYTRVVPSQNIHQESGIQPIDVFGDFAPVVLGFDFQEQGKNLIQ
jgi:hypothetical protein